LTRFISCLAHEEPGISVQGVYPKLTRTKMPEDIITGKYRGVMADHEVERFSIWDEMGDEMIVSDLFFGHHDGIVHEDMMSMISMTLDRHGLTSHAIGAA
jgi:hypothetical protein